MSAVERAVNALTELGLTEYESRCFVALTRLSSATATEVSQVADVPRSRVYDTMDRLERRGFVEVQQSDPREYKAVSTDTACSRLNEDYDSRIQVAETALGRVDEPETTPDEGMWAISKSEHVTDRLVAFVEGAAATVHLLVATEDTVDERTLDALESASERGVDVYVEVPTEQVRDRFDRALNDATVVVESDLEATTSVNAELPAKLLVTDNRAVVATGLREDDLPDVRYETAVWTYGNDHGFAAWVRELLADRLESKHGSP
ncbi:TrmB family transcriptional regulator [Natronobiforma cellulositropha]|uniref:TrmB family transcriptional regulator n=1 Tax=Natronobiforma cellulositropha TaxID=1679076 RepID=UPI0021D5981A|nr:helix-turn-helix domain-containing protein [Natronobiforma cellulositropha]